MWVSFSPPVESPPFQLCITISRQMDRRSVQLPPGWDISSSCIHEVWTLNAFLARGVVPGHRNAFAQQFIAFTVAVIVFSTADFDHWCFSQLCVSVSDMKQLIMHLVEDPGLEINIYTAWLSSLASGQVEEWRTEPRLRGSWCTLEMFILPPPCTAFDFALCTSETPFHNLHPYSSPWLPFWLPPKYFVGAMVPPTQKLKEILVTQFMQGNFQSSNTWVIRNFNPTTWVTDDCPWKGQTLSPELPLAPSPPPIAVLGQAKTPPTSSAILWDLSHHGYQPCSIWPQIPVMFWFWRVYSRSYVFSFNHTTTKPTIQRWWAN